MCFPFCEWDQFIILSVGLYRQHIHYFNDMNFDTWKIAISNNTHEEQEFNIFENMLI